MSSDIDRLRRNGRASAHSSARRCSWSKCAGERSTTFRSVTAPIILAGAAMLFALSIASAAAASSPSNPDSSSRSIAVGSAGRDSSGEAGLITRDGREGLKHDERAEQGRVRARNRETGRVRSSSATITPANSAANTAAISTPTTSSRTRIIPISVGMSRMEGLSASPVTTPPSDRRKQREFGEHPKSLTAPGNAEPSRWMKDAAGRCDGQRVPRTGMRRTSALHSPTVAGEDMTCAAGEPAEAGNRKPARTRQILSPVDTPLFTMFRKTKVSNVQVEWLTDLLDQATSNAVADGSSATFQSVVNRVRLANYSQISRESYDISDTQRAVNPGGIRDEMRYQMGKAINTVARRGNAAVTSRLYARNSEHAEVRLAA